jgi:hypothetical protein
MGLIAMIAFWAVAVKLWIGTGSLRLPLIFVAIWVASMFLMGFFGIGQFFIAVEALLVISMVFVDKLKRI